MQIISRGINFLEIYLLGRLKSNKIWIKYIFESRWDDVNYKILRRNKSNHEHSESIFKCNKSQKLVVDAKRTELSPDFPEEPTSCCMSGCANCVWLEYAEKLSKKFEDGGDRAIQEINNKVNDPNLRAFLIQELKFKKN